MSRLPIDAEAYSQSAPALDWRPVLDIHRGNPDGFVGFMQKRREDGQMWPVGAVKVRDVQEMIPGLLAQFISHDGYFTVNSFGKAGGIWKKTGLPYLLRRESMLLELCACYADLDVGRPEEEDKRPGASMDWQTAQIAALQRQRDGLIPPFSIMACSGRGVYLFWLLHDDRQSDQLPRAYPSSILRYKAVNSALHKRLHGLGVDYTAKDAARVLRSPGSIHTKVMRRVTYSLTIQADTGGRISYSLAELERLLGLETPAPSLPEAVRHNAIPPLFSRDPYRKTMRRGSRPQYRLQYQRTNELRAQDIETVETWRGGWLKAGQAYQDGHTSPGRGLMLQLYAQYLRGSGQEEAEVLDAVKTMAENCKPPYPSDKSDLTAEAIVARAYSTDKKLHFKNVPNKRLCDWLGISARTDPDLLELLESVLPESVKTAREDNLPRQADLTAARREAVLRIVDARRGSIPPLSKMAELLAADPFNILNPRGKPYSGEIIRQDYEHLGLHISGPGRRRRESGR
jgi:hypothetical protein